MRSLTDYVKVVSRTVNLCLREAMIEDDAGTLLAHGDSTMMVLTDLSIQVGSESPPKFLD